MCPSKLFCPMKVGDLTLQHRVVLAPLTRFRNNDEGIPGPLVEEYYIQRASVPGTLLITESTTISLRASGFPGFPGIYSKEQIQAWSKIADGVHNRGSFIYLQIVALGRLANPDVLERQGLPFTSSSSTLAPSFPWPKMPRPLTTEEINAYIADYAAAASNAILAGFDGVEVHGANGCLADQFIHESSNTRSDEYGGSVENRTRFMLQVIEAVVHVIGACKTGVRFSPWYKDMEDINPEPMYTHMVTYLRDNVPDLAYLHLTEPRVTGGNTLEYLPKSTASIDFIREIWTPRPLISAGGYDRASATERADKNDELIAFGRLFISNPDLPYRLREDLALVKGDRATYYVGGATGYTDYPFMLPTVAHR